MTPLRVLALCAGIGGLELGLHLAEPSSAPVAFVERDDFARTVLASRWPGVPISEDVFDFNATPWKGIANVVTAGFPCQPWSLAGRRQGTADERWIWPRIAEIVREVLPYYVFLENVPGLVSNGGLEKVLGSLAALGFDAEWGVFSCAALGASHRRERVFVVAHTNSQRLPQRQEQHHLELEATQRAGDDGLGLGVWAPGPDADWSLYPPAFWPAEQPLCGVANGFPRQLEPDRRARLRALGNAVSPPVAATAWTILRSRLRRHL